MRRTRRHCLLRGNSTARSKCHAPHALLVPVGIYKQTFSHAQRRRDECLAAGSNAALCVVTGTGAQSMDEVSKQRNVLPRFLQEMGLEARPCTSYVPTLLEHGAKAVLDLVQVNEPVTAVAAQRWKVLPGRAKALAQSWRPCYKIMPWAFFERSGRTRRPALGARPPVAAARVQR